MEFTVVVVLRRKFRSNFPVWKRNFPLINKRQPSTSAIGWNRQTHNRKRKCEIFGSCSLFTWLRAQNACDRFSVFHTSDGKKFIFTTIRLDIVVSTDVASARLTIDYVPLSTRAHVPTVLRRSAVLCYACRCCKCVSFDMSIDYRDSAIALYRNGVQSFQCWQFRQHVGTNDERACVCMWASKWSWPTNTQKRLP